VRDIPALSQIIENRKVDLRKWLIFQHTIFRFCLQKATLRQSPPASNAVTLAARTLQWSIFPSERMEVGLALCGVEEVVQMREHRHSGESSGVVNPVLHWGRDSHMFMMLLHSYKPR
jgi:hypothetical protein